MENINGLWLNLGCCDNLMKGFVNVDVYFPDIEKISQKEFDIKRVDLRMVPWPWETSTVDYILAKDIIEHLPDRTATMNEIWRVLKPGGIAHIEVPTTDGRGAFQDPTHVSFWNRNTFFYYENGNDHRERFGKAYGIQARFRISAFREEKLADEVTKLIIALEAVKK